MSADRIILERLKAELQLDIKRLDELGTKNEKAAKRVSMGEPDELEYAALGYTIHNIFNLIENYASRIAKVFENQIDPASWHRDLIERMQLEIAGVRPALWDKRLAGHVDELRRFRHVFRNMYVNDLDPRRVMAVQADVQEIIKSFRVAHEQFMQKLDAMAVDGSPSSKREG